MQTIRKTSLLGIMLTLTWPIWAAGSDDADVQTQPLIRTEAGQVEGYISVPVGEAMLPATLIADKLGKPHGKVLILHDSDGGIASTGLVETLRISLPESGWTTMTVALDYPQQPQLFLVESSKEADSDTATDTSDNTVNNEQTALQDPDTDEAEPVDNSERVSSALAYLNAQQPGPVVIVALGESVPLAISAASQQGEDKAQIWIAADLTLTELPELGPLLDIASQNVGKKNEKAASREALMRQANNQDYSQRRVIGAGHDFQGFENQVLTMVRAWLHKQFNAEVTG